MRIGDRMDSSRGRAPFPRETWHVTVWGIFFFKPGIRGFGYYDMLLGGAYFSCIIPGLVPYTWSKYTIGMKCVNRMYTVTLLLPNHPRLPSNVCTVLVELCNTQIDRGRPGQPVEESGWPRRNDRYFSLVHLSSSASFSFCCNKPCCTWYIQ